MPVCLQLSLVYELESVVRCRHVDVLQNALAKTVSTLQNSLKDKIVRVVTNLKTMVEWEKQQINESSETPIVR